MTTTWPEPRAAYIHVPFCARRCGYCNFTLVAGRDDLIERYLDAIAREFSWLERPRPCDTIFFGGGTPTQLAPPQLERLFAAAFEWLPPTPNGEISVEANPADLDSRYIQALTRAGIHRVSLGAQSFQQFKLSQLERNHRPADILRSFDLLRPCISSLSLDLIFGVPGETLDQWNDDLRSALRLQPDHLSIYGLTYERGTSFWSRLHRGQLYPVDEHLDRAMFESAIDRLTEAGYEHYEVSNFARPGHRCRHNETYWTAAPYLAFGPGAARYVDGRRESNHRSTTTYLRRVLSGDSPIAESEALHPEDRAREQLVFGLRRLQGIARHQFFQSTGFTVDALADPPLQDFVRRGLLYDDGHTVRLTRDGLLVSDALWPAFLRV